MKKSIILIGIGAAGIVAYLLLKKKSLAASKTPSKKSSGVVTSGGVSPVKTPAEIAQNPKSQIPLVFDMGSGGIAPIEAPSFVKPLPVDELAPVQDYIYTPRYDEPTPIFNNSTYGITYGDMSSYSSSPFGTKTFGDRLMINQLV